MSKHPSPNEIKIIECPRDAMQGMHDFIPTADKIAYLNSLLKVGFHTLDCGSFVSHKAIPQMRDTSEVLRQLDLSTTQTRLSVIVANEQGAIEASAFEQVNYLGFPFSVSEEFQRRNTNKGRRRSMDTVKFILDRCAQNNKEFVIYISMGFGNPYGDPWSVQEVVDWVGELEALSIESFSISDTVGVSDPSGIKEVFTSLIAAFPDAEFGAHFHTRPDNWKEKVEAAYLHGCKRFDGAIKGYGGCPMASDKLVGNMPTERLVDYFGMDALKLKRAPFEEALLHAARIFQ